MNNPKEAHYITFFREGRSYISDTDFIKKIRPDTHQDFDKSLI
jgi:hypothetical protein